MGVAGGISIAAMQHGALCVDDLEIVIIREMGTPADGMLLAVAALYCRCW
jgi:hypothetical protein